MPDLLHVNFKFATVFVAFNFGQIVPARVAEFAGSNAARKVAVIRAARIDERLRNMRARLAF